MVEGLATSLLCSVCDEVCKRGAQMKCCGTRACRSCAVLKINKTKKCWNEECGQEDIIPANDLKNDDLLRKAVEHFLKNGKMDPAHEKMLKKTGKNPKDIIGKDGDKKDKKAPVDVVEKFNQPCGYGEKCKRKRCLFVHSAPTLADKKAMEKGNGKPCSKGENCTNEKCEFGHPSAPKPATVKKAAKPGGIGKPCKFGAFCTHKDACKFDHPKTNKPCRFGAGCSSKSCKFDHSPSSKALDRAMSKFKRGIKPMAGDLRFMLANKKPMSGGMGGGMASMKMRQMERDNAWKDARMRNINLDQMLKMKEELDSMVANVMRSGRSGSGGMGEGYGSSFMARSEDRMDGRIWNRGYGGSSGRYHF